MKHVPIKSAAILVLAHVALVPNAQSSITAQYAAVQPDMKVIPSIDVHLSVAF